MYFCEAYNYKLTFALANSIRIDFFLYERNKDGNVFDVGLQEFSIATALKQIEIDGNRKRDEKLIV